MSEIVESPRGRPRDPTMEGRILDAALQVYTERGQSGFTFDAVAKRAGVGKPAIYLRWGSKDELLTDALQSLLFEVDSCDTGNVRSDLINLGQQMLTNHLKYGLVSVRLCVEGMTNPDLLTAYQEKIQSANAAIARAIIRRAVGRGELPKGTSSTVFLNALSGGILTQMIANSPLPQEPPAARQAMERKFRSHVERLVDLLLTGARNTAGRANSGAANGRATAGQPV